MEMLSVDTDRRRMALIQELTRCAELAYRARRTITGRPIYPTDADVNRAVAARAKWEDFAKTLPRGEDGRPAYRTPSGTIVDGSHF